MPDQVLDTLRLTQGELQRFLNELDATIAVSSNPKREHRRWRMQYQRSVLTIPDEHHRQNHFMVVPRNMSMHGVGLLLGTFVHPGAKCMTLLRCADGTVKMHPGVVSRCRLYERHVHDVGIRFEKRVNPLEYLIAPTDDLRFNVERVDVATLGGKVLIVDGDAGRLGAFAQHFNGSGVVAKAAKDGAAGRAMLREAPHLVFVAETLPDCDGCGFAQAARAEGHMMPLVVLAEKLTPELRKRAVESGAHEALEIGCPPLVVQRAAAEFLPLCAAKVEPPVAAEKKDVDGGKQDHAAKKAA